MSIHEAKKAFIETAQQYIDADSDPVMWNLNAGLMNLCQAVEHLESMVRDLDEKISRVSQQIGQIR